MKASVAEGAKQKSSHASPEGGGVSVFLVPRRDGAKNKFARRIIVRDFQYKI
jgi:hypothetical protein